MLFVDLKNHYQIFIAWIEIALAHIKQSKNRTASSEKSSKWRHRNIVAVANSVHCNQSIPGRINHIVKLVALVSLLDDKDADGKA